MLPAELFELAIYRWVKAVGLARPVYIADFFSMPGSNGEYALVVDRLKDLHNHGYIGLFKIGETYRVPYEKFASMEGENAFFGGGFTVEIAPGGRKYFEALEEKERIEKEANARRDKGKADLTTEEVLRALEHGERFDAATLEEFRDVGLIKIADVTHFQSRGTEYLYTGLTAKGLRLVNKTQSQVKSSSVPKLSKHQTSGPEPKEWDVFISHATEDKESIARDLAKALRQRDVRVWYDEFTLKLGDSLRESIDHGLANCRYGVVILSKSFFAKHWPQRELNGLAAIEVDGRKVILPVWHGVTRANVAQHSPMLADRLAVSTDLGLDRVVQNIMEVVNPDNAEEVVFGETNELHVGSRVHVIQPEPDVPRSQWRFSSEVWAIRRIDEGRKTALATPVLPSIIGPTPTVEGPMAGLNSPFKKANVPS